VGASLETAPALLEGRGLAGGEVAYREEADVETDTVLEQRPGAGAEVRAGDKVDLTVSK
jgi:beta-lactam-binding protein with PASTA domain